MLPFLPDGLDFGTIKEALASTDDEVFKNFFSDWATELQTQLNHQSEGVEAMRGYYTSLLQFSGESDKTKSSDFFDLIYSFAGAVEVCQPHQSLVRMCRDPFTLNGLHEEHLGATSPPTLLPKRLLTSFDLDGKATE